MKHTIYEESENVTLIKGEKHAFISLSVHPNNRDILFIEINKSDDFLRRLFVYNTKDKKLFKYNLPQNYGYLYATFTNDGSNILISRTKIIDGKADSNIEFVLMSLDGATTKVLPVPSGMKFKPALSPNGRYLVYWRAKERPPNSKTFYYKYNLYEYDLVNKIESLFQNQYDFFLAGKLTYFNGRNDKLLVDADTPTSPDMPKMTDNNFSLWLEDFRKQYKSNQIYIIDKVSNDFAYPLKLNSSSSAYPSFDHDNKIYYHGVNPTVSFFQMHEKELIQWKYPYKLIGYVRDAQVASDGKKLYYIFRYDQSDINTSAIAYFDLTQNRYEELDFSDLDKAHIISVAQ